MKKNKVKITEFSRLERKVAALWTRVSTEKQERNNCSLENQQRICREYAERNGIIIKSWYIHLTVSVGLEMMLLQLRLI